MPHFTLLTVNGDSLGAGELEDAEPANGTLVEHEDALLRVVGRLETDHDDDPERFPVLVVEAV